MSIKEYYANAVQQTSLSNISNSKLNIMDFGAIAGDGKDDLPALLAATERADRKEITTIYIPGGTYDVYGYLDLDDNMTIEGEGQNTTILVDHIIRTSNHIIRADNKNNIKIVNLTVMGPGIQKSGNCIHLENVDDYIIRNTKLSDCGSGHNGAAIYASNTSNGKVTHNIILSARNGYLTPQGGGSKNVLIGYNTILNSRDDAIHPQTGSDNLIVGNIVMNSGEDNIDLWQENNTLIENNTIVMECCIPTNSTLRNSNTISHSPIGSNIVGGIEIGHGSTNVVIKKNEIMGPAGRGIKVSESGPGSRANTNITIIDNNFSNFYYDCMLVQDSKGLIIHNNKLSNC